METPLTLLYTAHLRGDLARLPRLYSFLRQLKAYYTSEEVVQVCSLDPAQPPGRTLLLDLGDSCAPEVWHCQVTGGRSTLVVLDGMGYDAAAVEDASQLKAQMGESVRLALVDADTPRMIEDMVISLFDNDEGGSGLASQAARPYSLEIRLTPAEATRLDGDRLTLGDVAAGQVGAAQLIRVGDRWSLARHELHDLPHRALPDPTIAASVEFVLSEARYAQKRRASGSTAG